jgi:hypothetical protein
VKFTVVGVKPFLFSGYGRGRITTPGDVFDFQGRTYTVPDKPTCYGCGKKLKDGDEVFLGLWSKPGDRRMMHPTCGGYGY